MHFAGGRPALVDSEWVFACLSSFFHFHFPPPFAFFDLFYRFVPTLALIWAGYTSRVPCS